MPATSLAGNPRTSRRTRTATWRGGRTCSAVTKRQRDRLGLLVPGLRAGGASVAPSRSASGNGSSHTTSPNPVGSGGSTPGTSHAFAGRRPASAARVEAPVGGDPVEPGAERGAALERAEALPGGEQRVLEGVLGVLEGTEHPVAVHLELPAVRLGQLPERVAVPGPRPGQIRSVVTHVHPILGIDTGRGSNWAAGERPFSRRRGVCIGGGAYHPDTEGASRCC